MTNFDFLTKDKQFGTFSNVAIAAKKIIHIDPAARAVNCRRAKRNECLYSFHRISKPIF